MKPVNCICGAGPVVEKRTDGGAELFKYKCPNCKEKELPWLGQWSNCGALQEWNRIAQKLSYHKRTLEYNYCGACISPPFKTFKWEDKKRYWHVIIDFYFDNSMYYYCFDYSYKNKGHCYGFSVRCRCYPTFEFAKRIAVKKIIKSDKRLKKIVRGLFLPVQGELF